MLRLSRLEVLEERGFRLFFAGQVTSLIGRRMTPVALTFAVLAQGGDASDVGLVLMSKTVPLVAFVLLGGVIGDVLPRKVVMIGADVTRFASQGSLAALLLLGQPPLWAFMVLAGFLGLGEAFFIPAMNGLLPEITSAARLQDANAVRGVGASVGEILGPALGGALVALASPGVAIAVDAGTYGVSAACLAGLPLSWSARTERPSALRELRQGWHEFWSRRWLWVIVVQFAFWHMLVIAPFMVLGAVVAESSLGGASAWGAILTAQGVGAVCGGLAVLHKRPERPLRLATLGTFGLALPLALLALRAPTWTIAAGALVAGVGLALFDVLWDTTLQRQIPAHVRARVSSYDVFGSVVFFPLGYAIVGPLSGLVGVTETLWLATAWLVTTSTIVLVVPGVTQLRDHEPVAEPEPAGTG